ncbi:hypothetical protein Patl1_03127 [Pistacia atlantica]|uniref:Uncharacterized protein n=1 Tax=Pistacia atlantica TaxID=434234 RepID=A0ACC1CDA2_9ROSI|nr:hypothetical protein Patl1_03127 [Pistacia atlantica]
MARVIQLNKSEDGWVVTISNKVLKFFTLATATTSISSSAVILSWRVQNFAEFFKCLIGMEMGKITKKELSDSLQNLGIFIPDGDLVQMIDKIDTNGDGFVDIDEFGALYQTIMNEKDEEEDMKEAFNVFDQNGDGYITVDELRSVLASLGLKQGRTLEDCKRMIKKVDVDGDGMVDYAEFKQMMKGGGFAALQ